jgi:hypothetical protein
MNQRREEAWAKWRNLVSEHEQSGQSVAAFCRERGLPGSHFFYWKRRLRDAVVPQFVEVELAGTSVQPRVPARAALSTAIEVRLRNGRSLIVGPSFDANHLRAVLAVVESE